MRMTRRYGLLLAAVLLVLLGAAPSVAATSHPATSAAATGARALDRHPAADPAEVQALARGTTTVPRLPTPDAVPVTSTGPTSHAATAADGFTQQDASSIGATAAAPRAPPAGDPR